MFFLLWVFLSFCYLMLMIFGTLITLSSSSWFVAWVGLEMNMMGFIPFVGVRGGFLSEGVFSYFLVQAIGSLILFMMGLLGSMGLGYGMFIYDLMFSGAVIIFLMALKMGASPFHYWFLSVSEGLDWVSLMFLMTWQKLAPLGLIMISGWSAAAVMLVGVLSVIVGGLGGLNQLVVSRLLAYSSISHLGWMGVLFLISSYCGLVYFVLYVIVNLGVVYYFIGTSYAHTGQLYSCSGVNYLVFGGFCVNLFSLGGLPPFLGFYPSWLGITMMIESGYFWLVGFYVMVGLMTLYFYLRLGYVWALGGVSGGSWTFNNVKLYFWGSLLGLGSLMLLPAGMIVA